VGAPTLRTAPFCTSSDRLAVVAELEGAQQRSEYRSPCQLAGFAGGDVGEPDVRRILAVDEEGHSRTVGRPRAVRDPRAGRQLNRFLRSVGDGAGAIRFVIDEDATELVERLGERLHRHRAVTDLVDEPFLIRAETGERDIQVTRRQDRIGQFLRGHRTCRGPEASITCCYCFIST